MKYTYLFHRPSDGLTKIGRTQSPQRRFKALGGAKSLEVVALILGDMERSLHDYHKEDRVEGEWFSLSESTLQKYRKDYGVQDLPEGVNNTVKRTTIDVSPSIKKRLQALAKESGLPISVVVGVILEEALPDFELDKIRIAATALPTGKGRA